MIGAAAESVILDLRNKTVHKVASLKRSIPKGMEDWKIKTVSDALRAFFEAKAPGFPRQLREPFEAYWAAFAERIRATRNDAGHPASVESVTPDTVCASLLIFPELAKLANGLARWVTEDFA